MSDATDPFRAVVAHLVRMIQDSPDVRYFVGGHGSQMRILLVAALKKMGKDDPECYLEPAPHHANDQPRHERYRDERDRLERGIDKLRVALIGSDERDAISIVDRLQRGDEA